MKAFGYKRYFEGGSEEPYPLEPLEVAKPVAQGNDLLIRVVATTVNPVDWKIISGTTRYIPAFVGAPAFDGVNGTIPCADGVGVVVACNDNGPFKVGDKVCYDNGVRFGSLAEFVLVDAGKCCPKPKNASFLEAVSNIGLASGTAVMGVDHMLKEIAAGAGAEQGAVEEKKSFLVLGG
jgi:NADPH:quinone reductase-like Zn-dependent oxidoreductase